MFSYGKGRFLTTGMNESELARVRMEGGSRTSRENAQKVAKLLGEGCQQPWLLLPQPGTCRVAWLSRGRGIQGHPFLVDYRSSDITAFTE